MVDRQTMFLLAGAGLLLALWWASKNGIQSTARAIGSGAVEAADGLVYGSVVSVGDLFGIPETNADACQVALAEGRTWDASFACPAGTFLGAQWESAKRILTF